MTDALTEKLPRITVNVTEELIDAAIPLDSSHCMIADAIKAAVPEARSVIVDLAAIRWTNSREGKRYIYFTPGSVQDVLLQFDNGIKPQPFRFVLRAPAQVTNSGPDKIKRGGRVTTGFVNMTGDTRDSATKIGGTPPGIGPLSNLPATPEPQSLTHAPQTDAPEPNTTSVQLPAPKTYSNRGQRFERSGDEMRGRRRQFGVRRMGRPKLELGE
ncbi:MAG TPA: hypothetical protein VFB50_19515 [Chloroflexota bacterium]|nr:hypothetical protein [Chloroflexota bacterium]